MDKNLIVRNALSAAETLSHDIKPFEQIFLCGVTGIALRARGRIDRHICFEIISEDDGHWFPASGEGTSSYWIDAFIATLTAAREWCEQNALPDVNEDGIQYGWKFQ